MIRYLEVLPVIGMSPGNSYFKDDEIRFILSEILKRYGFAVIFVADIPAIETYRALGYSQSKAREKAILKGNNLKNKVKKALIDLGVQNDIVQIIDWKKDIQDNLDYQKAFSHVQALFTENLQFQESVVSTTREVLINTGKDLENIEEASRIGSYYLLSELAFLDFAPAFLDCKKVTYIYHRQWSVYEDYLAGKFDHRQRKHLGFQLLQTPEEYFEPVLYKNALEKVEVTKQLSAGFIDYRYGIYTENEEYQGFFYEIIHEICKMRGWELVLMGKMSYNVAIRGLDLGRFDIYISPTWTTEERLRQATFSLPISQSQAFLWAREPFSFSDIEKHPEFRMAVLETDITDTLGREYFPSHIKRFFSGLSRIEDLLFAVSKNNADFTICEEMTYASYLAEGGRPLHRIGDAPIAVFDNCFMFQKKQGDLCNAINQSLKVLKQTGEIEYILKKYKKRYT